MNKILVIAISVFCTAMLFVNFAISQTKLNEDVNVVKPYDPTVGDAYKINILPEINDTSSLKRKMTYSIYPKQIPVSFDVIPIRPAKMVSEPISKLYSTYIKAGAGNYNTLLGEAGVNMLRSKNYSGGVYIKHLSSVSKIKLANGIKSPASYSDNKVDLFGKKFYQHSTLFGDAIYERNAVHNYGYNTDDSLYKDTIFDKKQIFQHYNTITGNAGLSSNYIDSSHLNYHTNIKYQYFEDNFKSYQNLINVTTDLNKYYDSEVIGGNIVVSWLNKNSSIDTNNNALVKINPWVKLSGAQWRVKLGLSMETDAYSDSAFYHFYPTVLLQYNVIENFLIPFIGVEGKMQQNNFAINTKENPFFKPGLQIKNSNNKINLNAGIKGNFSKKVSFIVRGNYGIFNNMYFFVNDTVGAGNYFDVVYDKEVELLQFYGEVAYKNSEKLNIFLKGNYYKYTLTDLAKPWHKPEWDVTFTARYNLRNKIVVNADVFALGDRYAFNYKSPGSPYKLKKIIDANLGLEYRYSKILSVFLNINNITATKNYYWNFYPTQGVNAVGGLTYSF